MKYLIYFDQDYDDVDVYSFKIDDELVEVGKKVIRNYGGFVVTSDEPAKDSKIKTFKGYVKELRKELEEEKREYEAIKKKTQKDYDDEQKAREVSHSKLAASLGPTATLCSPFMFATNRTELLKSTKREITTLNKLLEQVE